MPASLPAYDLIPLPGEGPEDVVVGSDGSIYTGLLDGRILGVAPTDGTVREVARTDSAVRVAYQVRSRRFRGELVAMLDLSSSTEGCLAVGVGTATAAALAQRVLSETLANPDDALIRDCLGEIANVAAGQAKALLHGTPYQFSFSTPCFATEAEQVPRGMEESLVAVMATDVGEVVVQLLLMRQLL